MPHWLVISIQLGLWTEKRKRPLLFVTKTTKGIKVTLSFDTQKWDFAAVQ